MEADYSGRRLRRVALGQIGSHEQGNLSLFHQHRPPSFVPSSFPLASMPEQLYRPAPSPLAQSRCYACFALSPSFQAFRSARIASPSLPPFLPSVLPPNDKISTMRAVRSWSRPRPSDGRSVSLSNIEPIVGSSESHRLISTGPRSPMSPARAAARRPFARPPHTSSSFPPSLSALLPRPFRRSSGTGRGGQG